MSSIESLGTEVSRETRFLETTVVPGALPWVSSETCFPAPVQLDMKKDEIEIERIVSKAAWLLLRSRQAVRDSQNWLSAEQVLLGHLRYVGAQQEENFRLNNTPLKRIQRKIQRENKYCLRV